MGDEIPKHNVGDISDANGEVDTVDDNGLTRLAVTGDGGSSSDAGGCPVISKKLRYDLSMSDITVSTTLVTVYTYSGSGKLFGTVLDFSHGDIEVKLTIDGTDVIFDMDMGDLNTIQIPGGAGINQGIFGLVWENAGSRLRLEPSCALIFTSEIKFEAKRTGAVDRTLNRSLVALTKET